MTTNPEGALQTALIALLRADETIRSLLGHPARVWDARPAMAGGRVVSLRATYVDVFRGADWRSVLGVVRVRAVTEPI